jgi:PAS domain S-box-containing protein
VNVNAKILVVEDNPHRLRAVSQALGSAGYEVLEASTGEAGLRLAQKNKPDLILLDRVLPDGDGLEICHRIKGDSTFANIFVILLSDVEMSSDYQVNDPEAEADGCILRPISNRELTARVETLLRLKRTKDALRESEERFGSLFENAMVGLYRTSPDGRILMANPTLVRMLGYSSIEELTQRNLEEEGYEPQYPRSDFKQQVENEGQVVGLESAWTRQDGTTAFVRESAKAIRDENGNTLYYEGTVEDITERKKAEEALRESEQRFRATFEHTAVGMCLIGGDGCLITVNRALCEMLGYTEQELIGTRLDALSHPEDMEICHDCMRRLLAGELDTYRFEKRYLHKDGRTIWADVGTFLLRDASGSPLYFITHVQDITERIEAEEELRRRANQQEALNVIIAAAAAASDLPSLLETALDYTLEALGLEKGSIWTSDQHVARGLPPQIDKNSRQVIQSAPPDSQELEGPIAVEDWGQVAKYGLASAFSSLAARFGLRASLTVPILADGKWMGGLTLADSEPRPWSAGETALVEAVGQQLGGAMERLRLVEEIREQAHRVHQIISTVPEGVIVLDADTGIQLVNPAAREHLDVLTDAREGDILTHLGGHPIAELLTSPPKGLWHEVETEQPSTRAFELIARPIEDGPENRGWVLVTRDVTQEQEIQQRIERQERLAAVGQLAAGIAHDFNNLMAVIVLYSQMALASTNLPPNVRQGLETVDQQAKQATGLIQQILDFSRRATLERRPMNLVPFVKEQTRLLERTLPESIKIDMSYGRGDHTISADPTRVQQVVMNLAVNARDAMPEGGELHISLDRIQVKKKRKAPLPGMEAGDWVRMTVSDTGTGIPPDALPHIFEPFFTTKAPDKGTGLGLAQVWGIVTQHEGHIDVATRAGEGTTFTIYWPATPATRPTATAREAPALIEGEGETILIVEDSAATRKALVDSLEALNYQVLEATNGQEALDVFEQHKEEIALVLSDVVMPEMGGTALLHALRRKGASVPVVMLTGHPLREELEDLQAQGLAAWLRKPPSLETLARVIAQAIQTG